MPGTTELSASEIYRELLHGRASSEQYAAAVKREVQKQRREQLAQMRKCRHERLPQRLRSLFS